MLRLLFCVFPVLLLTACEGDRSPEAMDYKCFQFLYGADGVEQNVEAAMPFCQKAAEAGVAGSQNAMGVILLSKDRKQAVTWFKKAAEQGHTGAIEQLVEMNLYSQ